MLHGGHHETRWPKRKRPSARPEGPWRHTGRRGGAHRAQMWTRSEARVPTASPRALATAALPRARGGSYQQSLRRICHTVPPAEEAAGHGHHRHRTKARQKQCTAVRVATTEDGDAEGSSAGGRGGGAAASGSWQFLTKLTPTGPAVASDYRSKKTSPRPIPRWSHDHPTLGTNKSPATRGRFKQRVACPSEARVVAEKQPRAPRVTDTVGSCQNSHLPLKTLRECEPAPTAPAAQEPRTASTGTHV